MTKTVLHSYQQTPADFQQKCTQIKHKYRWNSITFSQSTAVYFIAKVLYIKPAQMPPFQ